MVTIESLLAELPHVWEDSNRLTEIGIELEQRSRLDTASNVLQRALELNSQDEQAWIHYSFACFRSLLSKESNGEQALTNGIEATNSNRLRTTYIAFMEDEKRAQEMIDQALLSEDPVVHIELAGALLWRGDSMRALELLRAHRENLLQLDKYALSGYCGFITWIFAQNRYPDGVVAIDAENEILPYLSELKKAFPNSYRRFSVLIQYYQSQKDWEGVIKTCTEALEMLPDEETVMLAMGMAYENMKQDNMAAFWYIRATGAKPSFIRARIRLGLLYERHEDYTMAELVFSEIISALPHYNYGALHVAAFLYRRGKTDEAIRLFKEKYDSLKPYEKNSVDNDNMFQALLQHL